MSLPQIYVKKIIFERHLDFRIVERELWADNPIKSSVFKSDIVFKLPIHEVIFMNYNYLNISKFSNNFCMVKFETMFLLVSGPVY